MKQPEYIEGPKARENFERGMIALFKVPKPAVGTARKKGPQADYKAQTENPRQGLEGDVLRFPRPCRFVARRFVFAWEFGYLRGLSGR